MLFLIRGLLWKRIEIFARMTAREKLGYNIETISLHGLANEFVPISRVVRPVVSAVVYLDESHNQMNSELRFDFGNRCRSFVVSRKVDVSPCDHTTK